MPRDARTPCTTDAAPTTEGSDASDDDLGPDDGTPYLYLLDKQSAQDTADASRLAGAIRRAKVTVTSAFTSNRVRVALDGEIVLEALRRTWSKATAGMTDAELADWIARMAPGAKRRVAGYVFEGWDAAIVNFRNRLSGSRQLITLAPPGTKDIDGWITVAGKRGCAIQHKAHVDNSMAKVREWLGKLGKDGILRVPKDAVGDGVVGVRVKRSPVSNDHLERALENAGNDGPVGALAGSLDAAAMAVPIAVAIKSVFGVYGVAAGNKTAEDAAEDILWDGAVAMFVTVAATGLVTTGIAAVSSVAVPALLIAVPMGFAIVPLVGMAREHLDTTMITRPAAMVIEFTARLSPVETTAVFVDQQMVRPAKNASKAAAAATLGFVERFRYTHREGSSGVGMLRPRPVHATARQGGRSAAELDPDEGSALIAVAISLLATAALIAAAWRLRS